jgi:thiosulfate/3-mercaptopyruvate sulfurtransferase
VYLGVETVSNRSSNLDCDLPSKEVFIKEMRRLQLRKNDTIVVYEHDRIFAGPRIAWLLRIFGAKDVRILNGCLKKWQDEGREIETGDDVKSFDPFSPGYEYELDESRFNKITTVLNKVSKMVTENSTDYEFIDVRNEEKHAKGSIIHFKNSYYGKLLNDEERSYKSPDEIKQVFKSEGIDLNKELIFSCGRGVSGCVSEQAARMVGAKKALLYDGAYQEYARYDPPNFDDYDWARFFPEE